MKDKLDDIIYDIKYFFRNKLSKRCRKCPAFWSDWDEMSNDGDCGCALIKDNYDSMWSNDGDEILCAWWILPRRITKIFAKRAIQKQVDKELKSWNEYVKDRGIE